LMPSQLALSPFDYVALGHLHRHQNLNETGYRAVVYSESIERIDFGERKEEKGFCIVSIPEKNKATYEFITIPTRPFIQIDVKLKAGIPQTEQILNALQKYDLTNAIVKTIYHIPAGKKDFVELKTIQQACQHAMDLIGVIPVHIVEPRENRGCALKVNMDLPELLNTYFATKPELINKKKDLIEKTLVLWQDHLDQQETESL